VAGQRHLAQEAVAGIGPGHAEPHLPVLVGAGGRDPEAAEQGGDVGGQRRLDHQLGGAVPATSCEPACSQSRRTNDRA
jgi:hypothetical protein